MKKLTGSKKTLKPILPAEPKPAKLRISHGTCGSITFSDATKIHPALKASFGYCLHKCSTLYKARFEEAIRGLKLNVHHMALLSVLSDKKSTNQNQMCDELGVDKASMVKLIDHIEKLQLVERRTSLADRRVKHLHVTAKGASALEKARKIRSQVENEFLKPLTPTERNILRSSLPRLLEQDKL